MKARVEWLPVGHIPHGYRRVFAIFEGQTLRHVVNFTPMPYERVYEVRELSGADKVTDPALWWGLSTIVQLVDGGVLLAEKNPDHADDGYLQVRAEPLAEKDMIPLDTFRSAVERGEFLLSYGEGGSSIGEHRDRK